MRITTRGVCAWLVAVGIGAGAGCASSSDDGALGTVSLNLTGQGSSGHVYRLRDAVITVAGPMPSTWRTEDDPTRTSLSANVEVGDYAATIQDGWRLERIDGATATTVAAQLASDNPVRFAVAAHQRTSVSLRFRIGSDEVDMTQGYDIGIAVEEPAPHVLVVANTFRGAVPGQLPPSITTFASDARGDVAPLREIVGPSTTLSGPIAVTATSDEIIVFEAGRIVFFPLTASGDVAPTRTIAGPATQLDGFIGGISLYRDEIYVLSTNNSPRSKIVVFPRTASGNVAPTRTLNLHGNVSAPAFAIDHDEIYVVIDGEMILVFPTPASDDTPPARTIKSSVGVCIEGFSDSENRGIAIENSEIYVVNRCAREVHTYPETADGPTAPLRVFTDTNTPSDPLANDRFAIQAPGNLFAVSGGEIYVANNLDSTKLIHASNAVAVYPVTATGYTAPTRILTGPHTHLLRAVAATVF